MAAPKIRRPRLRVVPSDPDAPEAAMPLMAHLLELRNRLVRAALGVLITTLISFFYSQQLLDFFLALKPKDLNVQIQVIEVTETFVTYFKVSLTAGLILSMPIIIYELLRFLAPGLRTNERRWVLAGLPFIILFFGVGVIFGYLVLLPNALTFLLGFGSPTIEKNILLSKYISFVTTFLLAVGVVFEMPPVMFMLAKLHIVSARRMSGFRRYAIVLIVIIAAIITPTPDPFNQMAVAVPMYLLYELGIIFARFAWRGDAGG
jgi:sec-independent protein translocase protein TatC